MPDNMRLDQGDLLIYINTDEHLSLIWIGRSEERDPAAFLNPFLSIVVEKLGEQNLIIDFRRLEYMNSSTVPPIVRMIKKMHLGNKIVKIVYSKDSKWQSATFRALRSITDSMVSIEIIGE